MYRFGLVAAILVMALACAPVRTAAPDPTPTPLPVLAEAYTKMVAPSNSALDALLKALNAPEASMTTTRAPFEGYHAALTTLNAKLPQFQAQVPATARADVQQLRQGVAVELGGLHAVLAATQEADWQVAVTRWLADAKSFGGASHLVRADLGLPPSRTPSPART